MNGEVGDWQSKIPLEYSKALEPGFGKKKVKYDTEKDKLIKSPAMITENRERTKSFNHVNLSKYYIAEKILKMSSTVNMNGAMPKKKASCGDRRRRNTGSEGGKNEVHDRFRWTHDSQSMNLRHKVIEFPEIEYVRKW